MSQLKHQDNRGTTAVVRLEKRCESGMNLLTGSYVMMVKKNF